MLLVSPVTPFLALSGEATRTMDQGWNEQVTVGLWTNVLLTCSTVWVGVRTIKGLMFLTFIGLLGAFFI